MVQAKTYAYATAARALVQLTSAAPRTLHVDAPQQHVAAGYWCVMKADTENEFTAYHINIGVGLPDAGKPMFP